MTASPADLLPKPFKTTDLLFRGLAEAIKTYGVLTHPNAVLRVTFLLNEDVEVDNSAPWVLEAKVEGFGQLVASEETSLASLEEAQKLDALSPIPVMTFSWRGKGQTLDQAASELRSRLTAELSNLVQDKQQESEKAVLALRQLQAGSTEDIWGDSPEQAEAKLEAILENHAIDPAPGVSS